MNKALENTGDVQTHDKLNQELRTAMHAVSGMAQILVREDITMKERRSCAEILRQESEKLLIIFSKLMTLFEASADIHLPEAYKRLNCLLK